MERDIHPDRVSLPPSPQLSRSQSKASDRDRTPSISGSSLAPPPATLPEPAYVNAQAATHVINNHLTYRAHQLAKGGDVDEETGAAISPSALILINGFLDQLLYSFLASSRSTSIISLKPGISEILKPRLAKEAIEGADQELRGYLAGGDDEELLDFHNGQELKGGSNLHQVFKRTRLRCMVYTRLGDMEEEDEEAHLEGESPQEDERRRLSRDLGNMSPAAAIFLTSVIEFIGEQTLMIAGEIAASRNSPRAIGEHFVVEDRDVEKMAFNKALGRLWRSWKKKGRVSSMVSPRPPSHDYYGQRKSVSERASRSTSISEHGEQGYFGEYPRNGSSFTRTLQQDEPRESGLPPKPTDLPDEPDFSTDMETLHGKKKLNRDRPRSMVEFAWPTHQQAPADSVQEHLNGLAGSPASEERPVQPRQRSSSLPAIITSPYSSPTDEAFTTPSEGPDPLITDPKERQHAERTMPRLTDASRTISDPSGGSPAVSTMYDGVLKRQSKPIPIDPILTSRQVSMSEYSDHGSVRNDTDLTPQALNFKEKLTTTDEDSVNEESRASTLSSNYSFQGGEQSPLASSEDLPVNVNEESDGLENGVFPARGKSLDQTRAEPGNFKKLAPVQGDHLKTYDDGGKAVKRDIPVLYEAASNEDVIYQPPSSHPIPEDEEALSTPTIANSKDIADAGLFQYGDLPPSGIAQNQPSMVPTKAVDLRRPVESVSAGVERAAVQRVVPSSTTSREAAAYVGRTSTSSAREGRPMTAGSSTSQISTKIKGIIGRESGDIVRPPLPRNTSSEVRRETTNGSRSAISSDKEQDFEQLIRSDETIQYTLTPRNMRAMEVSIEHRYPYNAY